MRIRRLSVDMTAPCLRLPMFAPVYWDVISVMASLVHILASDNVLAPVPALTSLERPPGHEPLPLM